MLPVSFVIQEHENVCSYIPVECPNKCLESVPRKQVSIYRCCALATYILNIKVQKWQNRK